MVDLQKCTDQPSKIPWSSRSNELLCGGHTFLMSILVLFKVRAFLELEEENLDEMGSALDPE